MSLQHLLLGLLETRPLHGYALRERARRYGWLYPMTNANIYPTLRKLEESGCVRHRKEVHSGRMRKVYEITDAGRAELQRWLSSPEAARPSAHDPVLLRFALLRGRAAGLARPWLERELEATRTEERECAEHLATSDPDLSPHGRLVMQHGLELLRLRARWLESALADSASSSDHADLGHARAENAG